MSNQDHKPQPWYREPFAWLILGIPAGTVVWCVILFNVAMSNQISMVSDDYYDEGMGINREISRDLRSATLGLEASVEFIEEDLIEIVLSTDKDEQWEALSVHLIHPTLGDRDQQLTARHTGSLRYRVQTDALMNGRWYLDIRDAGNDWRLKGETVLPQDGKITLRPQRATPAS